MSTIVSMRTSWLISAAFVLSTASSARAGLNDPACRLSAEHPEPVILIHGQGADVAMFEQLGVVDLLVSAGYCVYGASYGLDASGKYGRAHLAASADEILALIDRVLAETGASRVDLVSHSAGTGVVDYILLAKHRADLVRRVVSFGGLHHPYAHLDVAGLDTGLFLPNLTATARLAVPDVSIQQVIDGALAVYPGAANSLLGVGLDVELARSDFVADLFEPDYWTALHGTLSEPALGYLVSGSNARTLATPDSVASVCYTNIVGAGDPLTGESAGFQDPAPNVDNFRLATPADHTLILVDPIAQAKLVEALGEPCAAAPVEPTDPDDPDGTDDPTDPSGPADPTSVGCASGRSVSWLPLVLIAGSIVISRRRGRPSRRSSAPRVPG